MPKDELLDFLRVGCISAELENVADSTPEKDWRRKLLCAARYCENIVLERAKCLDIKQLLSVDRRRKSTKIIIRTVDQERMPGKLEKERVTVDLDDMETLAELALYSCARECKQGDCVKACRFREAFHRLGIAPIVGDVADGQCEFVEQRGEAIA